MKPFNYSVDKDGLKIKGSGMSTLRLEMVLASSLEMLYEQKISHDNA